MADKTREQKSLVWREANRVNSRILSALYDLGHRYHTDPSPLFEQSGVVPTWRLLNYVGGLGTIRVRLIVQETITFEAHVFLEVTGTDVNVPSECDGEEWLVDRLRQTTGLKVYAWKNGEYFGYEPIRPWWQQPTIWILILLLIFLLWRAIWLKEYVELSLWLVVGAIIVAGGLTIQQSRRNNN